MENVVPLYKKYRRFIYPAPAYKTELDRPIRIKTLPVNRHILARLKNWLSKTKKTLNSLGGKKFKPVIDAFDQHIGKELFYQLIALSHSLNRPGFQVQVKHTSDGNFSIAVHICRPRKRGKMITLLSGGLPSSGDEMIIRPRDIMKAIKSLKSLYRLRSFQNCWYDTEAYTLNNRSLKKSNKGFLDDYKLDTKEQEKKNNLSQMKTDRYGVLSAIWFIVSDLGSKILNRTMTIITQHYNRCIGNIIIRKLTRFSFQFKRNDFRIRVYYAGNINHLWVWVDLGEPKERYHINIIRGYMPCGCSSERITLKDLKEAMRLIQSLDRLHKIRPDDDPLYIKRRLMKSHL